MDLFLRFLHYKGAVLNFLRLFPISTSEMYVKYRMLKLSLEDVVFFCKSENNELKHSSL